MTISETELQELIAKNNAKYCFGSLRVVFWDFDEYYHLIDNPDDSKEFIARKKEQNLVALFHTQQQIHDFKKAHLPLETWYTILYF